MALNGKIQKVKSEGGLFNPKTFSSIAYTRNSYGLTLPFALILTFIFSGLVGVGYMLVSINLKQMEGSIKSAQAVVLAEGINERVKARLNTKSKIMLSPTDEEKLSTGSEEEEEFEDEELFDEEDFDEQTELFSEYYADEVVKISRFITFRNPPGGDDESKDEEDLSKKPEANVSTIGNIDIPEGTVLDRGIMVVLAKDEKIDLMLKDISPSQAPLVRDKIPTPKIFSLSPNYGEANTRSNFIVIGENLSFKESSHFSNEEISIENIKAGPTVEFLIGENVKPGAYKFYWDTAKSEYYVIPPYDGSPKPVIEDIKNEKDEKIYELRAGQSNIILMIYGYNLYQGKNPPVIVFDKSGFNSKVQSYTEGQITLKLSLEKNTEPGSHALFVATEGGLSNTWIFNVLPPVQEAGISQDVAIYTTSLTLLDISAVQNLLPLIDDDENLQQPAAADSQARPDDASNSNTSGGTNEPKDPNDDDFEEEVSEKERLSPFANTDLETSWLIETSVMIGKTTKTVSEVVDRKIPIIKCAISTNGKVTFNGGAFKVLGSTTAMTKLIEPTYLSNSMLIVSGPTEEDLKKQEEPVSDNAVQTQLPQTPEEAGFHVGEYVAVYMAGDKINDLDYGIVNKLGNNTIDLVSPGLMDFHYMDEDVFQFVPPIISSEESDDEVEKHIVPEGFALTIPNSAKFSKIFNSNLNQFPELADLYTNDITVPQDEDEIPIGFMGLTYIDSTASFDDTNGLLGKGVLIVDTRSDNQGKPDGDVEINGDGKTPAEFNGIVYIHGNLKINGNVNINGALIVDNNKYGQLEIASNAIGMITYDEKAIKQTILSIPFTSRPGTIMISNKPIELGDYVLSGGKSSLGASSSFTKSSSGEERLIEDSYAQEEVKEADITKENVNPVEEELIKFFE